MGWAARAGKTPGIRSATKSYRKKVGSPAAGYRSVPTRKWNDELKRPIEQWKDMLVRDQKGNQ
jgi:hypothetical protein